MTTKANIKETIANNDWSQENAKLEDAFTQASNMLKLGELPSYVLAYSPELPRGRAGIVSIGEEKTIKEGNKKRYVITVATPLIHDAAQLFTELGIAAFKLKYSVSGRTNRVNASGLIKARLINLDVKVKDDGNASIKPTEEFESLFTLCTCDLRFTGIKQPEKEIQEFPALDTLEERIQDAIKLIAVSIADESIQGNKHLNKLLGELAKSRKDAAKSAKKNEQQQAATDPKVVTA